MNALLVLLVRIVPIVLVIARVVLIAPIVLIVASVTRSVRVVVILPVAMHVIICVSCCCGDQCFHNCDCC